MKKILKDFCSKLVSGNFFRYFIMSVIFINSILIGVETAYSSELITLIQNVALVIFTIEIFLRWIGKESTKAYFKDIWNIFDIFIVAISYVPESIIPFAGLVTILRILRVFRILRLIKTFKELRLMIAVLLRSFKSLGYNAFLFLVFLYLFSIAGVTLFRMPDYSTANTEMKAKLEELKRIAPPAPSNSPDPYGKLGESFFTLFRILTGEDWTDIRYNLVTASKLGIINVKPVFITIFHVLWYSISAFLLLNLVVGAIINNYQVVIEKEMKQKEEAAIETENDLVAKISLLENHINILMKKLDSIK